MDERSEQDAMWDEQPQELPETSMAVPETITEAATENQGPASGELSATLVEPEGAEAPQEPTLERIESMISDGFAEVLSAFESRLALDRFKEDQISRLHAELQEYKGDMIARISRPLITGLIRLHDDLGKQVEALGRKPTEEQTPELFLDALVGFADDIEILLAQQGIESFKVPGECFEPRRQTALRTIPSPEPWQVGMIAERLRPGFDQGGKLLQKERVAVYCAEPTASSVDQPDRPSQEQGESNE